MKTKKTKSKKPAATAQKTVAKRATAKKPCAKTTAKKPARTTSKTPAKAARTPYVKRQTIWKSVGGGFSNPGETKICKIGDHKVLLTRSDKLNKYGNPIHTATVINKDGSLGMSVRSTGSATMIVSQALKKSGIDTK